MYVHRYLYCHATNDTVLVVFMCVGRHLDEQDTHLHLETRTPVTHVQTQMEHNSSPQVAGMKVWLVSVTQAGYAPVSLPTLSCDHSDVQCVLQVLTFFEQVIHNQVPTGLLAWHREEDTICSVTVTVIHCCST